MTGITLRIDLGTTNAVTRTEKTSSRARGR
jgi:hypothetical protein